VAPRLQLANGDRTLRLRVGRSRSVPCLQMIGIRVSEPSPRRETSCLKMPPLRSLSPYRGFSFASRLAKSTLTSISPSPDDYLCGPRREATRSIKIQISDPEESAV
jgi:hypothetical protein